MCNYSELLHLHVFQTRLQKHSVLSLVTFILRSQLDNTRLHNRWDLKNQTKISCHQIATFLNFTKQIPNTQSYWMSQVFSHSFLCWKHRNSDQAPISCKKSHCTFPAIPQLEEYKISVVVKNKVGEETESYSFSISDRGYPSIWTEFLFTTQTIWKLAFNKCVDLCVSPLVFPVVRQERVSPGVTDASVSWIVQGNLTQLNVLCQVTTDPQGTTEVSLIQFN